MTQLPPELLSEILTYTLSIHSCPGDILCANSLLYAVGRYILYSRLHFRSVRQLLLFSQEQAPLPFAPQEIRITLSGGTAEFNMFRYLKDTLSRCIKAVPWSGERPVKLPLELLSLCLNSHTSNPNLNDIYEALSLVE